MTWLGEPPRWGWLVWGPILAVLFGMFFAGLAVQHVIDQSTGSGWPRSRKRTS